MSILTYPVFIVGLIAAWIIGAAVANDAACAATATHPIVVQFIERLIFLCRFV